MPGVGHGIFFLSLEKNLIIEKNFFLTYVTPRAPMGFLNNFQPIRFNRWAKYSKLDYSKTSLGTWRCAVYPHLVYFTGKINSAIKVDSFNFYSENQANTISKCSY